MTGDYDKSYDNCTCGSNKRFRNLYDGYGIYLCKVCDDCEDEKRSKYRPDIFERYDADEDIDY
jgi:hypothetical protein